MDGKDFRKISRTFQSKVLFKKNIRIKYFLVTEDVFRRQGILFGS